MSRNSRIWRRAREYCGIIRALRTAYETSKDEGQHCYFLAAFGTHVTKQACLLFLRTAPKWGPKAGYSENHRWMNFGDSREGRKLC